MAVTSTFTPPAQPTVGSLTYVPLGGDGFSAPIAAYAVHQFELVGDVSGGKNQMTIEMDPRFCSLVSFVSIAIRQGTSADAEYRLVVGTSTGVGQIPSHIESGLIVAISSTVSTSEINKTSQITPMMMPGAGQAGKIQLETKNVDGDDALLNTLIYLFNIRVRETTPMGPLLWSRGSS